MAETITLKYFFNFSKSSAASTPAGEDKEFQVSFGGTVHNF